MDSATLFVKKYYYHLSNNLNNSTVFLNQLIYQQLIKYIYFLVFNQNPKYNENNNKYILKLD